MAEFTDVPERHDFPQGEEEILKWWEERDTFGSRCGAGGQAALLVLRRPAVRDGAAALRHILADTIKDIGAATTRPGTTCRARLGLPRAPIEHEIDKLHKINSKEDVLKMGIDTYNKECRSIVMRFSKEWEVTVKRCGRWIDFENDYKTMNTSFMESEWWVFKTLHEKGLVYRGFKVMPYSCALNTPVSNFEVQQNYKEVDDPAVVCAFPLVDEPETKLLAWTTTPWTLPSNRVCVHPEEYVKVKDEASRTSTS